MIRRLIARFRLQTRYRRGARRIASDARATLVLRYHSVGPAQEVAAYISPGISLEPARFEQHVAFLARRYDLVNLEDALLRAAHGRAPNAKPGIVLTFDDGYRDNALHALPTLARHGAPATIYVVAGSVHPDPVVWTVRVRRWVIDYAGADGRIDVPAGLAEAPAARMDGRDLNRWLRGLSRAQRDRVVATFDATYGVGGAPRRVMMDDEELLRCADGGITIGAHTVSHPLLTLIPVAEARREIADGRRMLESKLGRPIHHFSYPNPGGGRHENDVVRSLVSQAGYLTAATSQPGILGPRVDPLRIARWGVNAGWQERLLLRCLGEPQPPA